MSDITACCLCGEGSKIDQAFRGLDNDHPHFRFDESFVVLPTVKPIISERYFDAPASTNVLDETSLAMSVIHVNQEGLKEHLKRYNVLEMHAISDCFNSDYSRKFETVCRQCYESTLTLIEQESRRTTNDMNSYRTFQKHLENLAIDSHDICNQQDKLLNDIQSLRNALESTRKEHENLQIQLRNLSKREINAEKSTRKLLKDLQIFDSSSALEHTQMAYKLHSTQKILATSNTQLHKPPVLKCLFKIQIQPINNCSQEVSNTGKLVPYINNFRLSREAHNKWGLHWEEVVVAWGHATLLLCAITNASNFESKNWRIVPLINSARILHLNQRGSISDIFYLSHNAIPNVNSNSQSRFDAAIQAYISCAGELMNHLVSKCALGQKPPHVLNDVGIDNVPIEKLKQCKDWDLYLKNLAETLAWMVDFFAHNLCMGF